MFYVLVSQGCHFTSKYTLIILFESFLPASEMLCNLSSSTEDIIRMSFHWTVWAAERLFVSLQVEEELESSAVNQQQQIVSEIEYIELKIHGCV